MSEKMVPVAKGIRILTSDDAKNSVLRFETAAGDIDVGLSNKELSKLTMLLLSQSEKVAKVEIAQAIGNARERTAVTLSPIQSSAIGIGRGRSANECCLSVEVGNLRLAFWTDVETMSGICSDLPNLPRTLEKPQRHH